MKKFYISLLALTASITASAADTDTLKSQYPDRATTDEVIKSVHVITPGGGNEINRDSAEMLIRQFYLNQFHHFQDPEAPYFMLMSRDAQLALGVGGRIKLTGWFDWDGSTQDRDFSPYNIPIPKDPTAKRDIGGSPYSSNLFFTILGSNSPLGSYMGYVELGFGGYKNSGCKLKKAYLTMGDYTVGYTSSVFSDGDAYAPTIDGAGANGTIGHSTMQLRYTHTWANGLGTSVGIEIPSFAIQTTDATAKCTAWIPDLGGYLQYGWDEGDSHIRMSGLFKMMGYRDLITGRNHNKPGWGAQLSGVARTSTKLTLYAVGNIGCGIGSYLQDLGNGSYDLVGIDNEPGKMYSPLSVSWSAGARYYITRKVFASATLSELRYLPSHDTSGDEYKYGLYGSVNVMWNVMPRLRVGGEYLIGKRQNMNHDHAYAQRINALVQFSF